MEHCVVLVLKVLVAAVVVEVLASEGVAELIAVALGVLATNTAVYITASGGAGGAGAGGASWWGGNLQQEGAAPDVHL